MKIEGGVMANTEKIYTRKKTEENIHGTSKITLFLAKLKLITN